MTHCYYCFYGYCFKLDYTKYFLKCKTKYPRTKKYSLFIHNRNALCLGYKKQEGRKSKNFHCNKHTSKFFRSYLQRKSDLELWLHNSIICP